MPEEKTLGEIGESVASEYLKKAGYKILERNYRKPWGEIDIIAKKNKKIIFFEVKTIRLIKDKFSFLPEEQVREKKKRNLIKTAKVYLSEKKLPEEWQIDVIGIEFSCKNKCCLRHTKNAL